MTVDIVRKDLAFLQSEMSKNMPKWRRSINRYLNNGRRVEDLRNQYGNPAGFYNLDEGEDVGITPYLNVIRACVDTHVSKVSETKVRPFFNPTAGTFKTLKTCRNAQSYFDQLYERQDVHRKAIQAARFADIFERGCIWIDWEEKVIRTVAPWEYLFDPAEWNFGKLTRCAIVQKGFPLAYLKGQIKKSKEEGAAELVQQLEENPFLKGERTIYYDLAGKKQYTFAAGKFIAATDIEFDCPPVAVLYLEQPLKGNTSTSIADNVYTIQLQVESLCRKIHLAYELSPANVAWVMMGSEVKASLLTNEIGAVYPYKPVPGVSSPPVIVATPPALDAQYLPMLQFWIAQSMEMSGISQLSAQAKKPSGLNSGVALQTVEDVESERHNPWLQSFIRFFMDVANICIEVFPAGEDVLPKRRGRAAITWADIKRERDSFSIQFSASSSLSKDPKTKMEQIEKLIAMKVINPALAATLLEFPDLESAYSITSASYDYCQRIIERAVEDNDFEFFEAVNLEQLFGETASTLLRLDASDEKQETLDRLVKLLGIVKGKQDSMAAKMAPAASPESPIQPPTVQGPTNQLPLEAAPAPEQAMNAPAAPVAPQPGVL
ncbi:MAG TPA: hypothetical protein VJ553_05430 [Candidatus Paceibacterota bacterium]|nr:hypothetical protein [Candidatus Paceibacterota bacterium]